MDAVYIKGLTGVSRFLALGVLVSFTLVSTPVPADAWQEKQLFDPGVTQLERERKGLVTIYSGFTDSQVAQVMDQQFSRVGNMMFVNTVVTTPDGIPKTDAASGAVETEDDGC